ncbi:MAG: hypothetical protein RLZZ505_2099 [Verrucomicrobiota bacterium]
MPNSHKAIRFHIVKTIVRISASCACLATIAPASGMDRWTVPLGGNSYLTSPATEAPDRVESRGITHWQNEMSVFSIFFRADRAASLNLSLRLKVPAGHSDIRASVAGHTFEMKITGEALQDIPIGTMIAKSDGYVRVDLQGRGKSGVVFADVSDLVVESDVPGLRLDYVKDAAENRFYWGRRGPSIHLSYDPPEGKIIEYFHSELNVPAGMDPVGSYFMANGFGEGYFGMQVNNSNERRILFSVWSPFHTDHPDDIPATQRIELLAKGKDVRAGEFGNEGSGGQSYLIYPWKAGNTYRFLNRARPDSHGNTIYTAWFFAPEVGEWQLIASFRRPETEKYLTGLHSFLENFADRNGYQGRMALYENQWARDTQGNWHELSRARFSGDDIAARQYRLDYAGGAKGGGFFLRNGGFFAQTVKLGSAFERETTPSKKPAINLDALEATR